MIGAARVGGSPGATVARRAKVLAVADEAVVVEIADDEVGPVAAALARGTPVLVLEGVNEGETRKRLLKVERAIGELTRGGKLYGHLYDDLLKLKYLHQRYTNYLRWLESR